MDPMRRRARHRDDRGGALIEFALVLPLMLAIFAGIVDFGRMFQRAEVVTNAAREGARIAVLPGYTDADIQARVSAYVDEGIIAGAGANAVATRVLVTITPAGGGSFEAAQVTVNYTDSYLILGPIVGLIGGTPANFGTVVLTARSTMRMEVVGGS
jgi:Flp pilus assembly protein TadG